MINNSPKDIDFVKIELAQFKSPINKESLY